MGDRKDLNLIVCHSIRHVVRGYRLTGREPAASSVREGRRRPSSPSARIASPRPRPPAHRHRRRPDLGHPVAPGDHRSGRCAVADQVDLRRPGRRHPAAARRHPRGPPRRPREARPGRPPVHQHLRPRGPRLALDAGVGHRHARRPASTSGSTTSATSPARSPPRPARRCARSWTGSATRARRRRCATSTSPSNGTSASPGRSMTSSTPRRSDDEAHGS